MLNTALKIDQMYTSRFATTPTPMSYYPGRTGPGLSSLYEVHRKRKQRDFRQLVLHESETRYPKKQGRSRRRKLTVRSILQGGVEAGAFGTILATFMGSLWMLAQ